VLIVAIASQCVSAVPRQSSGAFGDRLGEYAAASRRFHPSMKMTPAPSNARRTARSLAAVIDVYFSVSSARIRQRELVCPPFRAANWEINREIYSFSHQGAESDVNPLGFVGSCKKIPKGTEQGNFARLSGKQPPIWIRCGMTRWGTISRATTR
jgi:hypothetical protein